MDKASENAGECLAADKRPPIFRLGNIRSMVAHSIGRREAALDRLRSADLGRDPPHRESQVLATPLDRAV